MDISPLIRGNIKSPVWFQHWAPCCEQLIVLQHKGTGFFCVPLRTALCQPTGALLTTKPTCKGQEYQGIFCFLKLQKSAKHLSGIQNWQNNVPGKHNEPQASVKLFLLNRVKVRSPFIPLQFTSYAL